MWNLANAITSPLAAATADDIFKSMGDRMNADVSPAQILAILASIVGLCVLVSVFKKRADRAPRKNNELNNPSKLLRQVAKEAGLSRGEVRELKKLAQLQGVENPLTLLLCPSLMQAAIAKRKSGQS